MPAATLVSGNFSQVKTDRKDLSTPILDLLSEHPLSSSSFVAYMDYAVVLGTYSENKLHFIGDELQAKYLQKMRVFNESQELLIWNNHQELQYRFREDKDQGEENERIDWIVGVQILAGTYVEEKDRHPDYTVIKEARGSEITVPGNFQVPKLGDTESRKRVAIETRNYLMANDFGQVSYCDTRFVKFCQVDKES